MGGSKEGTTHTWWVNRTRATRLGAGKQYLIKTLSSRAIIEVHRS